MKLLNKLIAIPALIFFISIPATAQRGNHAHSKNIVPDKGYWVIETNIYDPKTNTFYFYDDSDSLIYTEKTEGKRINIKSRATLKKLKSMLDNSLLALDKVNKSKQGSSPIETTWK